METAINFLVRASVYLLIFSAGYAFLRGRQFHVRFQRLFIIVSFLLSLALASVGKIPVSLPLAGESPGAILTLPEIIVGAQSGIAEPGILMISWMEQIQWWFLLPMGVILFLTVRLFVRLIHLFRTIRSHPVEQRGEVSLVLLREDSSPFSFFRWIFISGNLRGSPHFEKVLLHEQAHYRLKHSWDVIFIEIMRLLFWFHPAWYFFRNELQSLHEFEADGFVLKKFNVPDYQRALLDFALGAQYLPITNPFNVLMIKKRFIMMTKNQNQKAGLWLAKTFLLLPFVAAAFIIQSCEVGEKPVETETTFTPVEEFQPEVEPEYIGEIFNIVDKNPEFPGGTSELMKYLQSNLVYPDQEKEEGIQGTVFVTFVVEKDGKVNDVRILRGVSPGLDKVALDVVKASPNWIPGQNEGQPVRVQFNLPIRFVLN